MNIITAKDIQSLANAVRDQTTLATLLRDGLGWEIGEDFGDFSIEEPQIAESLPAEKCRVYVLDRFTREFPYLIALVEFEKPYQRRDLRLLLKNLKLDAAYQSRVHQTIFIVTQPGYSTISFVCMVKQTSRPVEIRTFSWNQGDAGRTVVSVNLPALSWALQPNWAPAWDVDALTENFYALFAREFEVIRDAAKFPPVLAKRETEWVQALLNRLLFVAFVERLGWMKAPGQGEDEGYLQAIYRRHMNRDFGTLPVSHYPATFLGVLQLLFHEAIDNPAGCHEGSRWFPLLGTVPYLNGGLFHRDAVLDGHRVDLDDEVFATLIGPRGLFTLTNFTVTESTPLDQNVEVDPEMLGKVFERIVNDRHDEGKYYTPRNIVEFMVSEAVKGYLVGASVSEQKAKLLVDDEALRNDETHIDADEIIGLEALILTIRAVDPACGSGAYLLGLLNKLDRIVDVLRLGRGDSRDHYQVKLNLLSHSIYGVDRDPTAVRIARLRLWLSLAVENRGQIPDPLPNLDFRVMAGDSLGSPVSPVQKDLFFAQAAEEFASAKSRHFHPEPDDDREELQSKVTGLRESLVTYMSNSGAVRKRTPDAFDWEVEFAEVFAPPIPNILDIPLDTLNSAMKSIRSQRPPGFDIVVANPPYVAMGLLKEIKPWLKKDFASVHSDRSDLFVYFFQRAVELLRPGGQLSFITSNKWLTSGYGKSLRGFLARAARPRILLNYSDHPVFQKVAAYPLVTIGAKGSAFDITVYAELGPLDDFRDSPNRLISGLGFELLSDSLQASGEWMLRANSSDSLVRQMEKNGIPLSTFLGETVCYGIKTGLNDVRVDSQGHVYKKGETAPSNAIRKGVFVVSRETADALSPSGVVRPFLGGKDIKRYGSIEPRRFLLYMWQGIPTEGLDSILSYLRPFREALETRATTQEWYELQQPQRAYESVFMAPKIVYPDIAPEARFTIDETGSFPGNTAYAIGSTDLFLLGVLNSRPVLEYYRTVSSQIRGGYFRWFNQYVEKIPIPPATEAEKDVIRQLVSEVLKIKRQVPPGNTTDLEESIDIEVRRLYGLDDK